MIGFDMSSQSVAIVTGGAGSGLGSGISCVLASHGWNVLLADRDEEAGKCLASQHDGMHYLSTDLTEEKSPTHVISEALERWGRIDGIVLNAGIGCVGSVDKISDLDFDRVFDLNVRAGFRLIREATRYLTSPGSSIVTLGSVHGRQPMPGFSAYAATKGAIEAITRAWAVDLGSDGIRANCVLAGMVDCPQTRQTTAKHTNDVDAYLAHWAASRQLLPKLVTNTDVGELVAYLLSDKAQGITGQSIIIDGGTTLMLTDRD
jgi:NAD(P)-dependent dehydrogenase (short-subunit alcohol dehydrogenase family)